MSLTVHGHFVLCESMDHQSPYYEFEVVLEPDQGRYLVRVPALPEVNTFGDTPEHALSMAREAIALSLEYRRDNGLAIPSEPSTQFHTVKIALPILA